MLEAGYYGSEPRVMPPDTPGGLVGRAASTSPSPNPPENENGARGAVFQSVRISYGLRMRSSSALPIAWVRFTTFSLRRIFCTWFFTVSGLILRIAPISKLLLPR